MIMQAYLIDPEKKIVESCDYSNDWKDISTLIECETFDVAGTSEFSVYIDDEGLYKNPQHFFMVGNYPFPLCGKGLLLGPVNYDTGETLESPLTLEEAKLQVQFLSLDDVRKLAPIIRE